MIYSGNWNGVYTEFYEELYKIVESGVKEIATCIIRIGIFAYIVLAISIVCTVFIVWTIHRMRKTQEAINRQNEALLKEVTKIESRLEAIQYSKKDTTGKPL